MSTLFCQFFPGDLPISTELGVHGVPASLSIPVGFGVTFRRNLHTTLTSMSLFQVLNIKDL